jgi:hypothetical protein
MKYRYKKIHVLNIIGKIEDSHSNWLEQTSRIPRLHWNTNKWGD